MRIAENVGMGRSRLPTALTLTCLLGGCATNLSVEPFNPKNAARAGAVHVLPYTFYKVEATWRVASCEPGKEDIGVKVTAEGAEADDAEQAFLIDPISLQTLLSISTFKVVYVNGQNRLESISTSVEDRTGPTLVNIATGIATIARAGVGLPMAPPGTTAPLAPPPVPACLPGIAEKVAIAKARKADLDNLNDRVDQANAEVVSLAARVATMGAATDEGTATAFGEALKTLQTLRGLQAAAATLLAQALKPISHTIKHEWPTTSLEFSSSSNLRLPDKAAASWVDLSRLPNPAPQISFQLERVGSFGRDPTVPNDGVVAPSASGLRYRTPARGRLVVCRVGGTAPCASANVADVLTTLEGPVAQLGYVNVLPVRTRAFGSTTFNAEYGAGGALKSAGYEQKAAPLEGMSSTVSALAGQVSPFVLANQPTQQLAADTARLEALKKKRDAEAALAPATPDASQVALDALGADTTLLNAQISNLQARVTLGELEAKLVR